MPVFFHARYSSPTEPGKDNAAALAEILQVAEATGASVHVDHITSTGGTRTMGQSVETLEAGPRPRPRRDRLHVPLRLLGHVRSGRPGSTTGWQQRFEITYSDLQIPGTDERLTESTFAQATSARTRWWPPTPSLRRTWSRACRPAGS